MSIPPAVAGCWAEFFQREAQRPVGASLYREVFDHPWLFPLQRMEETRQMIEVAQRIRPRVVMEIGSDKGGSFYHWVKQAGVTKAIAVELRGTPFATEFRMAFPAIQFQFLAQSSYDPATVAQVRTFLDGDRVDCLFIDGDKGGFMQDFRAYQPLVRPGGLIFFHDINPVPAGGSTDVFNELATQHRSETIYDVSEYPEILEHELTGAPPRTAYEGWYRIWKTGSCGVGILVMEDGR